MTTQTFTTLNALRGLAAIAVVTSHWRTVFGPFHAQSGYLAVDLFFLMSGFVIAYSYDARIQGGWTTSHFFKARLVRLYPMYILGVCITLCGIFVLGSRDRMSASLTEIVGTFLCNGLMLPSSPMGRSHAAFPLNSPAWTLYLEIVCNLAYVLFYRLTSPRNLLTCALLAAAGLVGVVSIFGTMNLGFSIENLFVGFLRMAFSFPIGILLCRAYRANMLPQWRLSAGIIVSACLCVFLYEPANKPLFELLCIFLLFPLAIIFGAHLATSTGLSDFLGNISYPLYATHVPMLAIILALFGWQSRPVLALTALACLLALLPACWALDRWIDRPIRARWSKPSPRLPGEPAIGPLSVA